MNVPKPTITPAAESLDSPPQAERLSIEAIANAATWRRQYGWGPTGEVRSARFFTGNAWGPKRS